MLTLREYSTSIPIPQGRLRQAIRKASQFRELGNEKAKITIDIPKHEIVISGDQQNVGKCKQLVKDFLEKYRTDIQPETRISQDLLCSLCLCEFDSPYSLQQCGHNFCRSCLRNYFESSMNSMMTQDHLILCCPFNECAKECLIRDIVSILGSDETTHLATITFEKYIQNSENDLAQCSGDNCNQVISNFRIFEFDCLIFRFIVDRSSLLHISVINALKSIV